jgi:hypothetical protein
VQVTTPMVTATILVALMTVAVAVAIEEASK